MVSIALFENLNLQNITKTLQELGFTIKRRMMVSYPNNTISFVYEIKFKQLKSARKIIARPPSIKIGPCDKINIKVIEFPSLIENTDFIKKDDLNYYIDIPALLNKNDVESIRIEFERTIDEEKLKEIVPIKLNNNPRPDINADKIVHEIVAVADPAQILDYLDAFNIDITYRIGVFIHPNSIIRFLLQNIKESILWNRDIPKEQKKILKKISKNYMKFQDDNNIKTELKNCIWTDKPEHIMIKNVKGAVRKTKQIFVPERIDIEIEVHLNGPAINAQIYLSKNCLDNILHNLTIFS